MFHVKQCRCNRHRVLPHCPRAKSAGGNVTPRPASCACLAGAMCGEKNGGTRQVVCGQDCCQVPQTRSWDCTTRSDQDNVQPLQVILHNVVCGQRQQTAILRLRLPRMGCRGTPAAWTQWNHGWVHAFMQARALFRFPDESARTRWSRKTEGASSPWRPFSWPHSAKARGATLPLTGRWRGTSFTCRAGWGEATRER